MNKNLEITQCLALVTFLAIPTLFSKEINAASLNFGGSLIEPPSCEVNSGELIDVDFGSSIGIKKVNGINYLQKVNYRIKCEPSAKDWAMALMLTGNPAPFDIASIQTDNPDLGIKFFINGEAFILGEPVSVKPADLPILEVVPVKKQGSTLIEGAFEANATLQAIYQ